jgi:lysophospholipase L1-like esterase
MPTTTNPTARSTAPPQMPLRPSMAGRPHPERPGRRVGPAGRVLVVGLTCFGLWALLAAPSLLRTAQASPLGARRDAALAVLRPLARLSSLMALDRLGREASSALGRPIQPVPIVPPANPFPGSGAGSVPSSGPPGPNGPVPSAEQPPGRSTQPSPVPRGPFPNALPQVRNPTASHPLRILAIGDSLGADLALGLARLVDTRPSFVVRIDTREATGLARPDYFDWPYQVELDLESMRPDVVVAMLGGNDAQNFLVGGHAVVLGTPAWKAEYAKRVDRVMQEVTESGRPLVWVGLPPMGSARLTHAMRLINAIARARALAHPGVAYLESWELFVGADGHYTAYLPDTSGQEELVREPDGVHLTVAGSARLAEQVFAAMRPLWL